MADKAVRKLYSQRVAAKKLSHTQRRTGFTDIAPNSVSALRHLANLVLDRPEPASKSVAVPKTIDSIPGLAHKSDAVPKTKADLPGCASKSVAVPKTMDDFPGSAPKTVAVPKTRAVFPGPASKTVAVPKTMADLPGPPSLPVFGNALSYISGSSRGQMHKMQKEYHQQFGKIFKEKLGKITNVSIADPNIIEELARKEGVYPFRPPYDSWVLYKKDRKQKFGIMSAVGPEWYKARQSLSKIALRPKTVAEYTGIMNDVADIFVNRVRFLKGEDGSVENLQSEMEKWALECVAGVLLEEKLGCLENEIDPTVENFINAVKTMFLTGHQLMVFAEFHRKWNTRTWRDHVEAWDQIYAKSIQLLDQKLLDMEIKKNDELPNGTTMGFLRHLVTNTNLTMEEIYVSTTELLLAGVDTSSNALSFALYLLAKNPNAQEKLQQEVDKVCKGNTCTSENLQNMPYLKAVVKESLRMFPVIPINARVMQEDTILNGYVIPKNTCVLLNGYTMAHDEEYFPNPEEFKPERWLRDSGIESHPFAMLPFGFGSRMCIGRRLAEQELFLTLTKMTQAFWMEATGNIETTLRTVITPSGKVPIRFSNR
uniref:Cholesterol side-chain cleavage enzyme, mitochondrial n=1 Tax=Crassostrea virginica TaxID=6565 RepID=A0A8B8ERL7_CRAVI|nr:1,25-dihydroxyvitamin D(3) 24-hydroxylase, mitochondrial-like [Crassostrea virginica]